MKIPTRPTFTLPGPAALLALACLILLFPTPIRAEEDAASHSAFSRHDLALFVGVTDDRGEYSFTLGVDYEYRIVNWFGAGGQIDFASGETRARLVAVAGFFRPTPRLILTLAPGVESFEETAHDKGETEFALRLGAAWEFEITERFNLLPAINADLVDGETIWVGGLNLGFRLGEPR